MFEPLGPGCVGTAGEPLGMPGCEARVSNDLLCPIVGANGTARLSMPVPSDNALVGAVFYEQGISLDPGANAAGIAVSSAARVTIGRL